MLDIIRKLAESGGAWKQMLGDPISRKMFFRALFFVIIFFGITIFIGREIHASAFFTPEKIGALLQEYWYVSWLLYIVIIVLAVMSPLPESVVAVAGGFVFGPVVGVLLTIIGETLGATVDFLLARILGREFVKRRFPQASEHIDHYSEHLGWQTVFLLRLFPSLTFDVLSYVAGISSLSFRAYVGATFCGLIPLALIVNTLGYSIDTKSPITALITVVVGGAVIVGVSLLFHRVFPKEGEDRIDLNSETKSIR